MKPIQVTKPEPEDWERMKHPFENDWGWNGYRIRKCFDDKYSYWFPEKYIAENVGSMSKVSREQAQEACFQHYLKEIGAEK